MTTDNASSHIHPDAPLDDHDAAALRALARAWAERDPLPDSLVPGVTFAVALDEVYAEVAQIQRQDSHDLAGVRGAPATTATPGMSFSTSDLTMTIMVTPRPKDRIRIDGWVTPDDVGTVGLRLREGTRRQDPEHGRFWFDDVPRGHVQLLVEDPSGAVRMVTPAVEL